MSSQVHPHNLNHSLDPYACIFLFKTIFESSKTSWYTHKDQTWIFPRHERRHIYFSYSSSLSLESFGTPLQKQHGERSSENETMTIYPDSLEQRWPLGMFWLSLSMHCQRDEEGDRKTRRIKTGCWQSETCLQVPDVFCTYNFFPCLISFMHNFKLLKIMLISVITCLNTMNGSSYQLIFRQCIRY